MVSLEHSTQPLDSVCRPKLTSSHNRDMFSLPSNSSLHPALGVDKSIGKTGCKVGVRGEAVQVQGLKDEVSPWPGGVLGMMFGELQMMTPSTTWAGCGWDSPKRHSNSSFLVMLGRGLTDRWTCRRRTVQARISDPGTMLFSLG